MEVAIRYVNCYFFITTSEVIAMTGDDLKGARLAQGLTQAELAHYADMSQGEVARAEAQDTLRPGTAARLEKALAKAKRHHANASDYARRSIHLCQWARALGEQGQEMPDLPGINAMLAQHGFAKISRRTYLNSHIAMLGRHWSKGFRRRGAQTADG